MTDIPTKTTRKRASRQKADLQPNLREAILLAAMQEFACAGFDAASILRIAAAAGVHHPHIYYYFKNKEQLWREAATRAFAPLRTQVETGRPLLAQVPPLDAFAVAIRQFAHFSADNRMAALIVARETLAPGTRLDWLAENILLPLHQILIDILGDAIDKGIIRPVPITSVIQAMIGAVVTYFGGGAALVRLHGVDPLSPLSIETHTEFLVDLFVNGLRTKQPPV
ncbi:TetR/AcrR family transcriptional regulator [Zavarzinia compransoris]|uniref:TetR/AcrR family transcriptional regulator n=1 Tax=Zavarzinia marina TaxID=2911065 RepID=UPI001F40022D|nr:TetR/AcrR family transcriptional regulator [Zavarzinia marina]MCF4165581.1 TetR/AcrR family transcriptional regulator [Zavarzinia marina]